MSDTPEEQADDKAQVIVKEEKSLIGGLLRFGFFVIAFFAIIFTVMANMGGSSDTLKESVENFVSDTLGGRPTHVERLVNMSFFPLVGFDVEGIEVRVSNETEAIGLRADKVRAFMSFWDVVIKKPRFRYLLIENLDAEEGVLGRQAFSIEKAFVDHNKDDNTAHIRASGTLGENDWDFSLGAKVFGKSPKYSYLLDTEKPFVFEIANLGFKGILKDKVEDYIRIEDFSYSVSDQEFLTGAFSFSKLEHKMLKFRGDMIFGTGKSAVRPDIVIDFSDKPVRVSGRLDSKDLVLTDLIGEMSLEGAYDKILSVLEWTKESGHDLDLKVEIKDIMPEAGQDSYGSLAFTVEREGGATKLSGVKAEPGGTIPDVVCADKAAGRITDQAKEETEEEAAPEPVYANTLLFKKLAGVLGMSAPEHLCHGLILEKQGE